MKKVISLATATAVASSILVSLPANAVEVTYNDDGVLPTCEVIFEKSDGPVLSEAILRDVRQQNEQEVQRLAKILPASLVTDINVLVSEVEGYGFQKVLNSGGFSNIDEVAAGRSDLEGALKRYRASADADQSGNVEAYLEAKVSSILPLDLLADHAGELFELPQVMGLLIAGDEPATVMDDFDVESDPELVNFFAQLEPTYVEAQRKCNQGEAARFDAIVLGEQDGSWAKDDARFEREAAQRAAERKNAREAYEANQDSSSSNVGLIVGIIGAIAALVGIAAAVIPMLGQGFNGFKF